MKRATLIILMVMVGCAMPIAAGCSESDKISETIDESASEALVAEDVIISVSVDEDVVNIEPIAQTPIEEVKPISINLPKISDKVKHDILIAESESGKADESDNSDESDKSDISDKSDKSEMSDSSDLSDVSDSFDEFAEISLPAPRRYVVRKSEVAANDSLSQRMKNTDLVIVNGDTVSMIIPERNFGRFDRGLYNYLVIPKGSWSFGMTASYGEFDTQDSQLLSIITDADFKGKIYSIKPSISYFFKNNQSIGLQFDYSRGVADLATLAVDFDEDINFSVKDVSYYTQSLAISTAYRNYVGLGMDKRFAVFNQVDLSFSAGSSRFKRYYENELRDTRTSINQVSLNFSPGVCVFIQDNVGFNVSFGVFGLKLRNEKQKTNGYEDGSRFTSGANFKFNIFNINFGLLVVI